MVFGLSSREQVEKASSYLKPLFKLAKKKKIKLEFIRETGITKSPLVFTYWDSLKKDRIIFIRIDKENRIIPIDRPEDCLLLFAYNIARFGVKRMKQGVCRPVYPSFDGGSKPKNREGVIFEKLDREKNWACLAEELEAWKEGMRILADNKLLDPKNPAEITAAVKIMFDYFRRQSNLNICRLLAEKDDCFLLDKSFGLRQKFKKDELDLANKFYDALSGREESWKETI